MALAGVVNSPGLGGWLDCWLGRGLHLLIRLLVNSLFLSDQARPFPLVCKDHWGFLLPFWSHPEQRVGAGVLCLLAVMVAMTSLMMNAACIPRHSSDSTGVMEVS